MLNTVITTKPERPMPKRKGLYKRGNVWWIRYADSQGHMFYESTKTKSIKIAEAMLIARKREVQEGNQPVKIHKVGNQSFKELAAEYSSWAERQKSFKDSKQYFIKALVEEFGNSPIRSFNARIIEKYQSKVFSTGKNPATCNRILATLQHMFTKALEWEMVDENIYNRIRKVKMLVENNRRLRYLSEEECHVLIKSCAPHLKPIIVCALHSGMRRGEILSLEWDKHIDLKHGFILLSDTKNNSRREIPINQTLMSELKRIPRHLTSPYVFVDSQGRRYKNVRKSLATALRKAGIKDFTFHDLRHTFASRLVMAGVDLATVKELLGHATLTMTLRYAHLSPGHMVKAVSVLDNLDETKIHMRKI